jgi:nucleotide-binding universal stress UspA family protein
MTIRTVLVPAFHSLENQRPLDAALAVARRLRAHISVMFIRPDPDAALAYLPETVIAAGVTSDAIEREGHAAAAASWQEFEGWRGRNGLAAAPTDHRLDSAFASWSERIGEIEAVVEQQGRVSDMIVLARPERGDIATDRALDAAIFGAGRPTLVVGDVLPFDLFKHVVISWNGSLEAAHAVALSMPILRAAEHVSIFTSPRRADGVDPYADLAEAFRWHGIRAGHLPANPAAASVGASLLTAADGVEASLIVMGAYTHSRVRQMLLGGVTKHVLANAKIPVLMTH